MNLIKVWSFKATNKISQIFPADINKDGLDEVLVASWDGFVYAFDPFGRVLWKEKAPTSLQFPASYVSAFQNGERDVIASFHRYLVSFSSRGKINWMRQLDSWIHKIVCADYKGEPRILVFTRKGNMYIFSANGEKICSKKVAEKFIFTPSICITDINLDYEIELLLAHGNKLLVLNLDGNELLNYTFPKEITSLCGNYSGAFVYADGLYYIQSNEKKRISNVTADKILVADVNGDFVKEIVALTRDEIKVLQYNLDITQSAKVVHRKKISIGNVDYIAIACDTNGDLKEEIIVLTGADKINAFDPYNARSPLIYDLDAYFSPQSLAIGNLFGVGKSDLIIPTGREEISVFTQIPKVSLLSLPIKQRKIKIGILKSQNMRINSSGFTIRSQSKLFSRSNPNIESIIIEGIPTASTVNIRIQHKRKYIYKVSFPVFQDRTLDKISRYVYTTVDDTITVKGMQITKIAHPKFISLTTSKDKLHVSAYEGIYLLTANYKDTSGEKTKTSSIVLLVEKGINANVNIPQYCLNEDIITITISNISKLPLKVKALIGDVSLKFLHSNKEIPELTLPPGSTRDYKLIFRLPIENSKQTVHSAIILVYRSKENNPPHVFKVPIYCQVVNKQWLIQKYKTLSKHLSENEILEIISKELNLPRKTIKEFLMRIKAKGTSQTTQATLSRKSVSTAEKSSSIERKGLLKYFK